MLVSNKPSAVAPASLRARTKGWNSSPLATCRPRPVFTRPVGWRAPCLLFFRSGTTWSRPRSRHWQVQDHVGPRSGPGHIAPPWTWRPTAHHPGAFPRRCQKRPVSTPVTFNRNRPQTHREQRERMSWLFTLPACVHANVQRECVSLSASDCGRIFDDYISSVSIDVLLGPRCPLCKVLPLLAVNDQLAWERFALCHNVTMCISTTWVHSSSKAELKHTLAPSSVTASACHTSLLSEQGGGSHILTHTSCVTSHSLF